MYAVSRPAILGNCIRNSGGRKVAIASGGRQGALASWDGLWCGRNLVSDAGAAPWFVP